MLSGAVIDTRAVERHIKVYLRKFLTISEKQLPAQSVSFRLRQYRLTCGKQRCKNKRHALE